MSQVQHPAAFAGALKNNIFVQHPGDEGLRRRRVGGGNNIFVRRSGGEDITLEFDRLETVADAKAMIYEKECIHPTLQRLMFGRRLLSNDRALAYYKIEKGSTIHLLKIDFGDGKGKNSIVVRKLTGDTIRLKVELWETTVAYVRGMIVEKAGIRQAQQHLVFRGRPLDDSNTLAHYGIKENSVLHLVAGRCGGGGPPEMEITTHPDGLRRRRRIGGVKIYINTSLMGRKLPLELDLSKTIADVKDIIQDMEGIPPDQQRLIFQGKELETHCILADYNIQNGSIIYLVVRLRGGGMIIFVQKLTGEIFELGVGCDHSISRIRDMINEKEGIHRTQQHLVLNGLPLDDDFTLKDYNIQNGSTLHLALVPLGAGSSREEDVETRMDDSSTDEDEEENELESSEESAKKLFAELFTDEDDEDTNLDSNDEEFAEKLFAELFADEDEEENELESSEESIEKDEYGLVQTEQPWARDHGHDQLSSDASWAVVAVNEAISEEEGVTGEMQVQPSENIHVHVHGIGALADQVEQKRKRWYKYSLRNVVFAISILATYLGSASTSFSIGKLAFKIAIGAAFIADAALSILMPPKWGDALVYLSWFLVVLVSYLMLVSFNKYYVYAILPVPLPIVVALLFQLRRFTTIMKKISTYLIKTMDQLKLIQQRRPGNEAVQNSDLERANNEDQGTNNDDDQHFDRIFELSGDIVNCGGITVIFGNSIMVGPASALGFLFFYTIALGLYLMMVTTVRDAALTPHVRFLAILLKVLLVITLITSVIHGVF